MSKKTLIPVGPYHPLQEEPELFKLYCDGEIVKDIKWETGYNHRSIEKLSESKTYEQVFFLVERICGICSTSHPFAFANAVEEIVGVEITNRAKYIRSIIAELERIHSHLLWVGLAGHFLGYNTVFMWAWKYREPILDLFEMITGNRNSYAMFRVGGVRRDIENSKIQTIQKILSECRKKNDLLTGAVMDDPVIHARTKGVGILTKQDVLDYCAVGPTARASGVAIDIRKDDPYAAYPLVNWKVITAEAGDVFAKAEVRLLEMYESFSIIEQCLEGLKKEKEGDITVRITEIPEGVGHGRAEAPRGEVFHFVVSDGSNSPARHKIRAPSYVNIATFRKSCIGQTIADATITLAAVDPCYCCTERMASVYDMSSGERIMNANELINLSSSKTSELKKQMDRK
ncbi:MAG TPA: nickel-dependent hydrogenase large subunit [Bacteroidales bacterium]|jgi:NADH-quinone oxidoreductase subunit D|nr:NADH:ubiquinone oxidoreductase [Bacteroidales bacterium]OQB64929.1 MAG: Formate hydrogenlyase subunit 5 precursor [Bacteroidetes bacterium ADurb.Bin145]HOU01669.1 nickel-dependent hydrogenase large subunit [Bacteroidales bacterium]HQG63210.1 nickel-dependent hydrogenase large subunit [Bacteroidales bacterium]HQK66887.1 nickel-dependent hydrogenase large subunit [Bacteroidales bacterium]